MDHFNYQDGQLFCENVSCQSLAQRFGTPLYVYSRATLERHWHACNDALGDHPHLICYAVKANSNLAVLNLFARLGSGFDVVSVGELERVLAAGGDTNKVVFSGVGKQRHEIERALDCDIMCFNIESAAESQLIADVAKAKQRVARVSLRINPDVDAKSHPYISTGLKENKFGIDIESALALYQQMAADPWLDVVGVDCHIGSQLTELSPFLDALDRVLALVATCRQHGIDFHHIDLGGGLGVRYQNENPPHPREHAKAIRERMQAEPNLTIILEPGRAIAANAGILLTEVLLTKTNGDKHFVVVDAAMNDYLRPALYQAEQGFIPVNANNKALSQTVDVVGPVCETGDFLVKHRELAAAPGDLFALRSAGAYGFVMSSNYNSRPRAAEIMVDGEDAYCVRQRETVADLFANESILES